MDNREFFSEINALVGSLAKALGLSDEETAKAVEKGEISIWLDADETGNRYVEARHGEKTARVYLGAIQYAKGAEPKDEPQDPSAGTP